MSRGGVNDNSDLRKTVGYADFSNLAPTLTEAVGNEPLGTTAKTLSGGINELKKSVSDGKKLLADTITKNGVSTAGDATFKTMADNIDTIASNANSASADSYNKGYAQGVTDADNRANVNSANYKAGYNAGVSAGGGIKEAYTVANTDHVSASNWQKATSYCTRYCNAGTWIVGVTVSGDAADTCGVGCSPASETYVNTSGKYTGGGMFRVELASAGNISAYGYANSNDSYTGDVNSVTAKFLRVK